MLIVFAAFMLLAAIVSLGAAFAPMRRPAVNRIASRAADDNGDDEEYESFAWEYGDLDQSEE